jgi:hypothetical protein
MYVYLYRLGIYFTLAMGFALVGCTARLERRVITPY